MVSVIFSAWHDPVARILNVDLLAVLVAVLLPWSTSGAAIALVLWIAALVPTFNARAFLHSLSNPVYSLPIAMVALAIVGTLWSDAPWGPRLYAISPTAKFLVLPLLLYHFERSTRGVWVFIAFLVSCSVLMAASWMIAFDPALSLKPQADERGIFVKNYIDQSQEFALCAIALAYPIVTLWREKRTALAIGLAALAASFVINMTFVIVSRTAMVTMPVMLAVFALIHLRWRSSIIVFSSAIVLAGALWTASPELRQRADTFSTDYQRYKEQNMVTSIGVRLEFWKKSLTFFADAPFFGHGTGSSRGLFAQAAVGKVGSAAEGLGNPHNQTLNVAIQWGLAGIVVLYAMWLVHLLLFRGDDLMAWIGLMVVVQNVSTSLFNSHLFDFHEGWMYVLGVGVAGGMTLGARNRRLLSDADPLARPG
jgi:O-antigen ligase